MVETGAEFPIWHEFAATKYYRARWLFMTHAREHIPILLVEDDPVIAIDAEDMLTSAGFECLLAYNTSTAGAILDTNDVCAAIFDYDLGGETSLSLAEQAHRSRIPYAFVTGRNRSEIIGHAPEPTAILSKPVDYADVARQLALHINVTTQ